MYRVDELLDQCILKAADCRVVHHRVAVGIALHLCWLQMCIQNNPNEARNMLLQNPQLAYALLQAQIVMKIVDPQVALVSFHS